MKEALKLFIEKAQQDEALKAKLNGISEEIQGDPQDEATKQAIIAAIIPLAKEKNIDLTPEDFSLSEGEISDRELADVAGGSCFCAVAGAGGGTDSNDGNVYGCACAGYGQGGDGDINDRNCQCVFTGIGDDFLS